MVLDVDMFRSRLEDGVVGASNGALIVSFQRDFIGDKVLLSLL